MVFDGTRGGRHENDEADRKPAVEDASHDAGGLPLVPIKLRFDNGLTSWACCVSMANRSATPILKSFVARFTINFA